MHVGIRFGTVRDLETAKIWDPTVREHVLSWKLQNEEIIVAELEDSIVGYLRLDYMWSKIPYIGLLIVKSELRSQGIGGQLLAFAEQVLKEQKVERLYSSSVVNETKAQAWHRRMGFRESGFINGINGGDLGEVFFVKDLV